MSLPWILCIAICLIAVALIAWVIWRAPIETDDFWQNLGDGGSLPSDYQP
jgi:hypothetical protein